MNRFTALLGAALVALSVIAVIQTVREVLLWKQGFPAYAEDSPLERTITFGGHTFSMVDNQPTDPVSSETPYEGMVQLLVDGQPLGSPTRALVRRGRPDMGRYHTWVDSWVFRDRTTGEQTLWLARRLEPVGARTPRFEVTMVRNDGAVQRRVLRGWQLSTEYRLFRATQFVRRGEWSAFPLAFGDALGLFPPLVLIFPIGTFLLGVYLIRRGRRAIPAVAAV